MIDIDKLRAAFAMMREAAPGHTVGAYVHNVAGIDELDGVKVSRHSNDSFEWSMGEAVPLTEDGSTLKLLGAFVPVSPNAGEELP